MPNAHVNKVVLGSETLLDLTDTTATAADVMLGKVFHLASGEQATGTASGGQATITGTYTAGTKTLEIDTDGVFAAWWGGIDAEFLHECRWSKAVSNATNWPLTPTTSAQNLLWTSDISTTETANAVIDRWGKGYHNITTALDFANYNYILVEDGYVKYAYTSPEASLGKVHVCYDGFTYVYHWGERPMVSSGGAIVRPDATNYGAFGSCAYSSLLIGYRTAAGTFQLANNATYGVSAAAIAPSQQSTSKKNPDYFNLRTPTFGIRAHNTYMPVASYSYVDWAHTTCSARWRVYRVPVEYGVYTVINDRLLDMIQDSTFPAEPI